MFCNRPCFFESSQSCYLAEGFRLYLPTGGRWLGAQPQDGGSHRAQSPFDCRRWCLPKTVVFLAPIPRSCPENWGRVSTTTSKYHPISKPELHRPLAPSVTANAVPAPSRRELWGLCLATLVCHFWGSSYCNPSVKNQRFLPAPFRKGAPACRRCQFRTIAFYYSFLP